MVMTSMSLRLRLRDETADLHTRVDELGAQVASVSNPTGYQVFLLAMARVTAQFAELLDRSSEVAGVPPRSQRIGSALAADLVTLGVEPSRAEPPAALERPADRAAFDAAALGVGYVLEGSALGAAVLLAEVVALPAELPTTYLSLLVEARADRWPSFVEGLNAADLPSAASADLAVQTATRVFRCVEAAFVELGAASKGS